MIHTANVQIENIAATKKAAPTTSGPLTRNNPSRMQQKATTRNIVLSRNCRGCSLILPILADQRALGRANGPP